MKTFTCKICRKTLDISTRCGDRNWCKPCKNLKSKQHYQEHKDVLSNRQTPEYRKMMYLKHKEKRLKHQTEYYNKNKQEIYKRNKTQSLLYQKERWAADPLFRLKQNIRRRLRHALRKSNYTKQAQLSQYLGCSIDELKIHLQSKFTEGMTWDNYGEWEIDHIVPLGPAQTDVEIYKLNHYTNLQPMWSKDNKKKGGKLPPPQRA